jgi:hypothetical protein
MARFDFESPGAAFTGQIAQVLTQRKADERQRLLDSLQFSAEKRADDQAKRQAEEQAQQIAESKQRMEYNTQQGEIQRVAALTANHLRGENPEDFGYAPKDIDLLKRWGAVHDEAVPQVTEGASTFTDTEGNPAEGPAPAPVAPPAPKMRPSFVGTAKEQEQAQLQKQSAMMISGLIGSDKPEEKELGHFYYNLAQANDGIVPPEIVAKFSGPQKHIKSFDIPSNTVKDTGATVGPNDEIVTRPWGPRDYAPRQIVPAGVDDDNNTVYIDPNSVKADKNGRIILPGVHPKGSANSAAATNLGIPTKLISDHAIMVNVLRDDVDPDTGKASPSAIGSFRTAAADVISGSTKATLAVKRLAKLYATDMNAYIAEIKNGVSLSPQEVLQLDQLKQLIAPGEDIEQILTANPVHHYKKVAPPAAKPAAKPPDRTKSGSIIDNMMSGGMS